MQDNFQLTDAAARKYESHSVPAMFGPLARATLDRTDLPKGARVVDIACGTGALTREIACRLPGVGQIAGTDLNGAMIDVAKANQPAAPHALSWHAADVTDLPFDDASFDVGFIQQGLQFFPDKPAALAEVHRVIKPHGSLILNCWSAISPFNDALSSALAHYIGDVPAQKARAPFSFRDGTVIRQLLIEAGFSIARHETIILDRRFEDLRAQILALPIEKDLREAGPETTENVVTQTANQLRPFKKDGVLNVPQEAHFFCATRK